jgi:DNA-binding transcriptional LysR family regulator
MFTFDQLRSLVVLADELHFGRAAERLNMTQPPLSRQIQKLEQELGFELFVRGHKRVEITRAGEVFAAEAQKLLTMADSSREIAKRIAGGAAGLLSIGMTASGTLALLGSILERLDEVSPGVEVTVREMVSKNQIQSVVRGAIDLAFLRTEPDHADLIALEVLEEPLVAAIGRRHPLAVTKRELSVSELEGERVLRYDPNEADYFRSLVSRVLEGVRTRPSQQITQIHSMVALVAANQGIALVPKSTERMGMPGVVFRPVQGAQQHPARLLAVWRRDNTNPAFPAAISVLRSLHEDLRRSRVNFS